MHIFFSGIGGAGIGPLALIAKQAGYEVSGSDKQESAYIENLKSKGIDNIVIGQTTESIASIHADKPIDWLIYSSAIPKENPSHPELVFAQSHGIKSSKRDDFLNKLLTDKEQKLIAVAGTHGKTTTTAMAIWLFKQLKIPISYSVGAKLSFGEMGEFDSKSEYFIYEADEYDRNFLSFEPYITLITGIAYDHPDIYPTKDNYNEAFRDFLSKSKWTVAHPIDLQRLSVSTDWHVFSPDEKLKNAFTLSGKVNRENSELVVQAVSELTKKPYSELVPLANLFPGVSRRFEKITENVYSDYAHTPEKILGALQMAHEVAGDNVIVVYEGLHNTRQHFIKEQLKDLFKGVRRLYIVPSYLAREDKSLKILSPEKLCKIIKEPSECQPAKTDEVLKNAIRSYANNGNLVLCFSAGGGSSLDEWLREEFSD